ncbi:MAG: hypothetical protein ABI592_13250 [Acidobacteriota bacterium]
MHRSKFYVLLGSVAMIGAVACSGSVQAGSPVRVTRDANAVASCQKVSDIEVPRRFDDREVTSEAAGMAREKGADTVVLAEGSRSGAAYRCGSPTVAGKQ